MVNPLLYKNIAHESFRYLNTAGARQPDFDIWSTPSHLYSPNFLKDPTKENTRFPYFLTKVTFFGQVLLPIKLEILQLYGFRDIQPTYYIYLLISSVRSSCLSWSDNARSAAHRSSHFIKIFRFGAILLTYIYYFHFLLLFSL